MLLLAYFLYCLRSYPRWSSNLLPAYHKGILEALLLDFCRGDEDWGLDTHHAVKTLSMMMLQRLLLQ